MRRKASRAVGPRGSRRRRWVGLIAALFTILASVPFMPGLAVHDIEAFELDKNASNDTDVVWQGELGTQIKVNDTSVNVCERTATPATPFTILVEAERMTVDSTSPGSFGGSCAGTKTTYSVTRAVDGTTLAAHGGSGVSSRVSVIVEPVPKAGPDWDQVYDAVLADPDATCAALGLVECSYIYDGIGPTTFTGGASKDHLPIEGWNGTSGASPDKAEILNAYAAKAIDDGEQILYFGMDRYGVDGSTDIGFWFFKNEVAFNEADGTFTGTHAIGDILILGTFTQGGATSTIRVFRWVGTGGNESGTIQGPDGTFGDCVPGSANDSGCATVNNTSIEVPWMYTFKGASESGWVPAGGFFEGGVNLTDLGLEGCFSSFLAETRSSPEITAILKDFTIGEFEACDTGLVTTPADGAGTALTDSNANSVPDTSIGTGTVSVKDQADLDVTGISEWDGALDFYLCGPLDAPATCDTGGKKIGATLPVDETTVEPIVSSAATLTEVGRYCWRGEFTSATTGVPDATDSSSGECFEVLPVEPTISTSADATAVLGVALDDTATLGGTATQPGTDGANATYPSIDATAGAAANGTITFSLYGPADTPTCTNLIGSSTVTVTGDGAYDASTGTLSGTFTPTAAGTYYWIASYSGDSPNTLSVSGSCGDGGETSVVTPNQPAISTVATAGPVPLGTALDDTATLTGTAPQPDGSAANGTITFTLYGPAATPTCTAGNLIGTSVVTVSGDGNYVASTGTITGTLTPTVAGTYYWIASYSGDLPNTKAVSGACGDDFEASTVIQLNPSISTAQTFTVKDSATITVDAGAGDLAGSVRFRLYENADCSGDVTLVDQTVAVGGGLSDTVETTPVEITTSKAILSWKVEYTSTNQGHTGVTSSCAVENASLLIDNG